MTLFALFSFAIPSPEKPADKLSIQTAPPKKPAPASDDKNGDDGVEYTTFNGMKVPPLKEIDGEEFDQTVKDGYWYNRAVLPVPMIHD